MKSIFRHFQFQTQPLLICDTQIHNRLEAQQLNKQYHKIKSRMKKKKAKKSKCTLSFRSANECKHIKLFGIFVKCSFFPAK